MRWTRDKSSRRTTSRWGCGGFAWAVLLFLAAVVWVFRGVFERPVVPPPSGPATVEDRLREFGDKARARWRPFFQKAGVPFPPEKVAFLAFKDEKVLEVYAAGTDGKFRLIRRIPILGASGGPGPKLREGDRQVPEGLYRIESLNPNSRFHVSLRVNYPNPDDLRRAAAEGRTEPGSDIMIHGGNLSIGCLAVGDEAAEDLFALAAWVGLGNLDVVLAPWDFRTKASSAPPPDAPEWTAGLYSEISERLRDFP